MENALFANVSRSTGKIWARNKLGCLWSRYVRIQETYDYEKRRTNETGRSSCLC